MVFLALGILTLPMLGLGQLITEVVFALLLVLYVIFFPIKSMRHAKKSVFAVLVVETVFLTLIAAALILQQFGISPFEVSGVTRTIGILLWVHGAVRLIHTYLTAADTQSKYAFLAFLAYIALATLGVYMFAVPFVDDATLTLVLCVVLFLLALTFTVLGFTYSGKKKEKKSED